MKNVTLSEKNLEDLHALALELALAGGRFVRDQRPDKVLVSQTKETDLDVVTIMDTQCEALLRAMIREQRPDDAILGEEGDAVTGTSGLTWVLDPIDGTVNYLYDVPAYAVSIGVVTGDPLTPGEWEAVAGAVYNPIIDEVFHAHRGGGARLSRPATAQIDDGFVLQVQEPDTLTKALVGTGFSYSVEDRRSQAVIASEVLVNVRDLRRMGAASLDLCAVAAGRLDAYYERGLHPWDMAAGCVIVSEAGGVVSGLLKPVSREMTIAGAPGVHAALHRLLVRIIR